MYKTMQALSEIQGLNIEVVPTEGCYLSKLQMLFHPSSEHLLLDWTLHVDLCLHELHNLLK